MEKTKVGILGVGHLGKLHATLYKELKAQNKIGSINDWNKLQVKFLSAHHYYTDTANKLREVNKEKQIERIKKLIQDYEDAEKNGTLDDFLASMEGAEGLELIKKSDKEQKKKK